MNQPATIRHQRLARSVELFAHPLFLIGALLLWWAMEGGEVAALVVLVFGLVTMHVLERLVPAVPQWRQGSDEKWRLLGVFVLIIAFDGAVVAGYEALLLPVLSEVRDRTGADVWLSGWPILVQVLFLYFASDFIYYWFHRGIHSSSLLWPVSGHGFHHAFHNLHAINVGATHPFEVFFLAIPMVFLAAIFGVSVEVLTGATVLLIVNATLAHANVRMQTPVFSWFFTSSNQHRRHHSVEFEVSNTNFACNAIIWDRLFGTYSRGPVHATGIGPRQPQIWDMFWLPFREPEDVETVSTRARARRGS